MSRRIARALTTGTVLSIVAVAASCGGSQAPAPVTTATAAAAPTVDVVAVVLDTLKTIVPLPGELRPFETVPVFSKVSGFVKSIDVDRGSHVKQGQVIIRLEAPELMAQRAEAEAKLQSAQAQLAAAQSKLASDESTYARLKAASSTPGVVAGNELEVAARALDADRAQVSAQQQNVAAATQARQSIAEVASYLEIKAPFDGLVTERNVHPGALVSVGSAGGAEPLVRIEAQSELRLIVPVPESYAAGISAGKKVEFTVSSYPGRTFTGAVARTAHALDPKTRTMAVEIAVANGSGDLAPGAFCEVRWPMERSTPSLFVPPTAVASTLDRTFVVRIRDGKADWVDVKKGASTGKLVEVFGDLHEGDQVAVRGTDELRSGMTVATRVAGGK
jgi:RND family efflux transporter MFP subunit